MQIAAFVSKSFKDWPGKVSAVVMVPGCNFKCDYCFSYPILNNDPSLQMIEEDAFFEHLFKEEKKIEGVVITGGEPTLQGEALLDFCEELKENNFLVKIHTNGYKPEILEKLIDFRLVDFISMDIKNDLNQVKYSEVAGMQVNLNKIVRSIALIKNSRIESEFVTTYLPGIHSKQDIINLVKVIGKVKRFVLQEFTPRSGTLNPEFKVIQKNSIDEMLQLLDELPCFSQELRIRTLGGDQIVIPRTYDKIKLQH